MTDGEEVAVADAGDRAVPPAPGRMPIGSNGAVETGAGAALDVAPGLALRWATRLAKSAFGAADAGAAAAIRLAASGQRIRSAAEAGKEIQRAMVARPGGFVICSPIFDLCHSRLCGLNPQYALVFKTPVMTFWDVTECLVGATAAPLLYLRPSRGVWRNHLSGVIAMGRLSRPGIVYRPLFFFGATSNHLPDRSLRYIKV